MAEEADQIVDSHEAQGLPWLPTYVLDDGIEAREDIAREDDHQSFSKRRSVVNDGIEACGEYRQPFYSKERNYNTHRRQPPYDQRKLPADAQSPLLPSTPPWKSSLSLKPDQKPKNLTNWAAGGPGMQAVFLDSGQRSCGTGVFLPSIAGTDVQKPRKPAFAPVLLPSRVVQALNLNVHGLGLQIKPRVISEDNNNVKGSKFDRIRNKKNKDAPSQICVISRNPSSSPEIFLPKEWTY